MIAVLLTGCATPIGCGQRALLDYSDAVASGVKVQEINEILKNRYTSMYDLKVAAIKLGYKCEARLFLDEDEFSKYSGYAIIMFNENPKKSTGNHFVLVRVVDGKTMYITKEEDVLFPYKIDWPGVALLLSS